MKKKVGPSFYQEFKSPRLYLDDLKKIEDIFLNELNAKYYHIWTKDYEYSSYEEIGGDYKDRIFDLTISSFTPDLRISLSRNSATITCNDHELKSIGAAEKISEIVKKRERKLYWFAFERLYFIFMIFPFLPFTQLNQHLWIIYLSIPLMVFVIISSIMRMFDLYKTSRVDLTYINDKDNFLKRKKDEIILVLVSGTLGVLGTIIANYFGLI